MHTHWHTHTCAHTHAATSRKVDACLANCQLLALLLQPHHHKVHSALKDFGAIQNLKEEKSHRKLLSPIGFSLASPTHPLRIKIMPLRSRGTREPRKRPAISPQAINTLKPQ